MLVVPGRARRFPTAPPAGLRRPRYAHARRKSKVVDRRERARNARIARIQNARRRARKHNRLRARLKRRNLVVLFRPRRDAVPAKPVVQRQARPRVPTVLREQAHIFIARIERIQLALVVLARHANQKIRKVHARFRSEKTKLPLNCAMGCAFTWSA